MLDYDVAIAGGGPAGAAAAVALARAGRRVLLADAGRAGRAAPIGESLPPSSRSLLRELGVLAPTLADGHRPSHGTASAWGSPALEAHDFLFQPHGPGWQLDRTRFDAMLRRAAAAAGVDVREGARLTLTDVREREGPTLASPAPPPSSRLLQMRLRGGPGVDQDVRCRWLIDASGRPAALARRLGASRRRYDRLVAFYLRLRSDRESDRDGRTLVEAVEDGWWYSVLLPDGERLVALLSDSDRVEHRRLLEGAGLWTRLHETHHLSQLCAEHHYAPQGPARGVDASSSHLERAAGEGWVAVGDAALAFDPLSSKGIANALYTGLRAAGAVDAALRGDDSAVGRYAEHLLDVHRVYRHHLRAHYAAERRWPDAPFWRRRALAEAPDAARATCAHAAPSALRAASSRASRSS